jgi:aspartate aminotransferase
VEADPGGAFYAFLNVRKHFGRPLMGGRSVDNSTDFCSEQLQRADGALVSGDGFGAPGYVRMSFATATDSLARGLDAIGRFLG